MIMRARADQARATTDCCGGMAEYTLCVSNFKVLWFVDIVDTARCSA